MKNEKKINSLIVVEPAISIEKNCIIIYTSWFATRQRPIMEFFFKSKETLLKSEIPNYHTSILILHDFVGCPTGYFGQNCSKPCVYPSFGERCQGECNCTDEMCNIITGCKGFYQIHNYQLKNRNI